MKSIVPWLVLVLLVPGLARGAELGLGASGFTVVPSSAPANQFATGISSIGVLSYAQPAFTNLSGSATTAQLPLALRLATSDCSAHSVSTGTAETVLKTFSITAASLPVTANSIIKIKDLWTYTNSANNKTCRIRIGAAGAGTGGTQVFSNILTTTATMSRDVLIFVRGTSSEICHIASATQHESAGAGAPATAAIDLTANWELAITGQTASSGETIQLEAVTLEILTP